MGLTKDQMDELAILYAKKFIARSDTVAVQNSSGAYAPAKGTKFTKKHLTDHLSGAATYGHYVLNTDDTAKVICFDIDLTTSGRLPTAADDAGVFLNFEKGNPRAHWQSRTQGPARQMLKYQMRMLAHKLVRGITEQLSVGAAVTYTGNKGIHVYALTGKMSAAFAREGAQIVMDATGCWMPIRGDNFYKFDPSSATQPDDPDENFEQFEMEVFPKQDSLDGLEYGNLLRLPLGVNRKSPKDPTFFVDMTAAMSELKPMDPIEALTRNSPWG